MYFPHGSVATVGVFRSYGDSDNVQKILHLAHLCVVVDTVSGRADHSIGRTT